MIFRQLVSNELFNYIMQAHRPLPRNLPTNNKRISFSIRSPAKRSTSPSPNTVNQSSLEKNTSSPKSVQGRSRHQIKSKQKPSLSPSNPTPTIGKKSSKVEDDVQSDFRRVVLGMMEPLSKNIQNTLAMTAASSIQQQPQTQRNEDDSNHNRQKEQTVGRKSDRKIQDTLIHRIHTMLQERSNWKKIVGQLGQERGYRVVYFRNQDKFMGGFQSDEAEGHGTYYCQDMRKRVMGIWNHNQLNLKCGLLVQDY